MDAAQTTTVPATRTKSTATVIRKALGSVARYGLVIGVALLFLVPWIWLVSTSLKLPSKSYRFPQS